MIARSLNVSGPTQRDIDALWDDFAPSTHHDFITGTATDYVYEGEQLPLLSDVIHRATAMRDALLSIVSNAISAPGVLVFNSLGYPVQGIVEIPRSVWSSPPLQVLLAFFFCSRMLTTSF